MLEFLPASFLSAVRHVNILKLYEIRLRAGKPATVNYDGRYRYLGPYGVTDNKAGALRPTKEEISETVFSAGKFSVYAVEEQMRRGFITAESGERIGLAGEYVFERGKVLSVRDFTSLCIRVPHEATGCAEEVYRLCFADSLKNVLIMSPPGIGKTTFLRELCRLLSLRTAKNILVCDERGEISGAEAYDTGETSDVFLYADKATAFESGIRAMRPDIIVTDELSDEEMPAIVRAERSGVKVIASAHFSKIEDIKPPFGGNFERYVLMDGERIGKVTGVYDGDLKEIAKC